MRWRLIALVAAALAVGAAAGESPRAGEASTNSVGIKMVYIPAGEFTLGSPADEKGRQLDEAAVAVRIARPFRMSACEITQAQWTKVMGSRRGKFEGQDLPADSVSWTDAVAFCRKLSELEGKTYRLPTEAEWEYACRAGSAGRFGVEGPVGDFAWYDGNAAETTHPVGTKKPNAWGLFDMHGNVAEWCADYYAPERSADGAGPKEGSARVVRGGSWMSFERGLRCAARANSPENYQMRSVGFRVVMEEPRE